MTRIIDPMRVLTAMLLLLGTALGAPAAFAADAVVNVNTATPAQLQLLPRVGPSIASRIVEFRDENGPFQVVEDLMLVRGIGEKTFALIEPYVALQGQTTLTEKVRSGQATARADAADAGSTASTDSAR